MNYNNKQQKILQALGSIILMAFIVGVLFMLRFNTYNNEVNKITEQPVKAMECQTGTEGDYTFVRCKSERYGRMVFFWADNTGRRYIIGDGMYTRDYGVLLPDHIREVVITFTDMNGNAEWQRIRVNRGRPPCSVRNNCYQAIYKSLDIDVQG